MNLLHIDSSILGERSVSRALSQAVVDRFKAAVPDLLIVRRDLAENPLPHFTAGELAARLNPETIKPSEGSLFGDTLITEFLTADVVVLGVAFYNWGIASQLKAWIDRIAVAGRTFRYTESGPVGLAGGKRMILTIARGGIYSPGTPMHALEHAETYLRGVFGVMGVEDIETVAADGISISPDHRTAAIDAAMGQVAALKIAHSGLTP